MFAIKYKIVTAANTYEMALMLRPKLAPNIGFIRASDMENPKLIIKKAITI